MLLVNVFFCFLTMKAQNGSQITGKRPLQNSGKRYW